MYVCVCVCIEEDVICVQLAFHELHLQPDRAGKTKKQKTVLGGVFLVEILTITSTMKESFLL